MHIKNQKSILNMLKNLKKKLALNTKSELLQIKTQ